MADNNRDNNEDTFRFIKFSPFKRSKSFLSHIPPKVFPPKIFPTKAFPTKTFPTKTFPPKTSSENQTNLSRYLHQPENFKCSNCKTIDHNVENCKSPIYSYGLIVFNDTSDSVLLVQRKDTYAYIALIETDEYQRFSEIAKKITRDEQYKIINWDFEKLWADVINNPRTKNNKKLLLHKKSLFEFHKIRDIVKSIPTESLSNNSQWSFPKGRIKFNESWSECAIRETCEETHLTNRDVWIIMDDPLYDTNIGDDGKKYISVLFVARTTKNKVPFDIVPNNETKQCAFVNVNDLDSFINVNILNKIKEISTGLQL